MRCRHSSASSSCTTPAWPNGCIRPHGKEATLLRGSKQKKDSEELQSGASQRARLLGRCDAQKMASKSCSQNKHGPESATPAYQQVGLTLLLACWNAHLHSSLHGVFCISQVAEMRPGQHNLFNSHLKLPLCAMFGS